MDRPPGARTALAEFTKGLWRENPVIVALLGLCPAMAVTNSLVNALAMGVASTIVLVGSSTLVSLARKLVPGQVRISVYIIIIATFTTVVDLSLQALLPAVHKQLGAFIALIVVNCIILGRQEAFASKQPLLPAVADALGMAAGLTLALSAIGAIREILGSGSLLGFKILGDGFEPWAIMILPPGGFLSLGAILWVIAYARERRSAA